MSAFDACFASVLAAEGGFSNNAHDPGGVTQMGVTQRAWEAWVGHTVTIADMKALTAASIAPFYRAMYWNVIKGDDFPLALSLCLFHCAVNSGPSKAATLLQRVVGASPDGSIGPSTFRATAEWIKAHGIAAAVVAFQDAYRAYYRSLSQFEVFGRGWTNRANDVEQQAMELAA